MTTQHGYFGAQVEIIDLGIMIQGGVTSPDIETMAYDRIALLREKFGIESGDEYKAF